MKIRNKIYILFILVAIILILGCPVGPFLMNLLGRNNNGNNSAPLKFDLSGAKAIAGTEGTQRSIYSKSKGVSSKLTAEDEAALVKILEDGTVKSIISSEDGFNGWMPDISFISIGSDKSVYICFSNVYSYWDNNSNKNMQLIRIYPDTNNYDIIWPTSDFEDNTWDFPQIDVWSWWGMDNTPLLKAPDGKLYFKVTNNSSNSQSQDIYVYDPETKSEPQKVTPDNVSLNIESFMVDSKKHIFIKSEDWGESSYMRYYTEGETGFKSVYYSSFSSDTWIRGYTADPNGNFLIINGNFRSMNGIIKVNILGPKEINYEIMYSNANNGSNWINLYKYYNDSWENNTEIIDQISEAWDVSSYEWRDDVKTSGSVDIEKIKTKIAPYFYDTPQIKTGTITVYNDSSDNTGSSKTYEEYVTGDLKCEYDDGSGNRRPLWQWITNYPEDFLRNFFNGQLFKDWLAANNMSELNFDNIGAMLWASDGSLYGLYDSYWWSGNSNGTKVVKLLDSSGNRDLEVLNLAHGGKQHPSQIKIIGDTLYYRYAVLDSSNEETGLHRLASINFVKKEQKEITPNDFPDVEIISYDVSDNGKYVYFLSLNPQTNEVVNGRIDVGVNSWEKVNSTIRFSNIKVIE